VLADGLTEALGDTEALVLLEGLIDAEAEAEGDTELLGLIEADPTVVPPERSSNLATVLSR
jgi:hypothetical protein